MKAVIVGCGRVGAMIAAALDAAGHEVAIIDMSTLAFERLPETFRGKAPERIKARKEEHIDMPGNDNKAVEAHISNFLDAVQGKAKVIADPVIGQQAAIGGHMATLSYRNKKMVRWDNAAGKVHFV